MASDNSSTVPRDTFGHRQMLHRLSTHSSTTSNSSKRGSARVTKTTPSNSPHYVQRRRTNPTYSTRSFPRMAQDSPYSTRDQRLRHYYSQYPMEANRPMSWHPGSERLQAPYPPMPVHDPTLGNTIAEMENLAVTGTPQPSVEQSIQDAFSLAYGFPVSQTPTDYVQPGTFPPTDPSTAATSSHLKPCFPPQYPSYDNHVPTGYSVTTQEPNDDMYNLLADYGLPQQPQPHIQHHPQPQLDYPSPIKFPYQAPIPWQESMTIPQAINLQSTPVLQRKKSKELVGLGLYDDKKEDFLSTFNSDSTRESLGKDLKLEETWQPPNNEEEDEESYSSDEAEEEDPEALGFINQAPVNPQTFYPTYGDLSDQSFFFNDDDQKLGHDVPYVNYVALGPEDPAKAQAVADTGNFMWL